MRSRPLAALVLATALAACTDIPDPSALSGPSARAATMVDPIPASAVPCIERTRAEVIALFDAGVLNAGQRNSLESKIDAILAHIANGRATPARNVVDAYNNEVDALERSGRITSAQAETIRLSLECATPVSIAAGERHTCVLLANGAVWCWGNNSSGQLGDGTTTSSLVPVQVTGPNFARLDAGGTNACALLATGEPYCWGANANGQLGNGTTTLSSTPTAVSWPVADPVAQLTVGWQMACGRVASGATYCWGQNGDGQLGTGATFDVCGLNPCSKTPVQITTHSFADVDAGIIGACGLDASGVAYCWGRRNFGAIGDGVVVGTCIVGGVPRPSCTAVPTPVSGGHHFRTITFGAQYACAIRTDGATMCWGINFAGQLGIGFASPFSIINVPTLVTGGLSLVSLASDDENSVLSHACALDAGGNASCWGWNHMGQLGTNASTGTCTFGITPYPCSTTPIAVMGGYQFKQLALGIFHSCGLTTDDQVLCWGGNSNGQLGDGTTVGHFTPMPVATPWLSLSP